jgi:hypothetical protein
MSNFLDVDYLAYTTKISKTNFPSTGSAQLHMSVNSTWIESRNGRTNTYVERISDDRSTGEVLRSRFLYNDSVKNLDYFEIDSPHGFSTFGLSQLSGSGNPFQLITLTVASHINPPDDNSAPSTGACTGKAADPATVQKVNPPPKLAPPDPGKTEKVYTNANGVISQATLLQSTDRLAQISLGLGVTAKDRAGAPLSTVTLSAIPVESLPPVPPSATYTFAGMAYNFEPEGATFSPAVSLSFSYPPDAPLGQDFVVKTYDHQSGTWVDLPTRYDASTGRITAEISHFCCIALFTKPLVTANSPEKSSTLSPGPMQAPPETPPPPPPRNGREYFYQHDGVGGGTRGKKYLPDCGSRCSGNRICH